jgi:hypothetical protein
MNDDRDKELDQLLSSLRTPHASELQKKRWQRAVQEELVRAIPRSRSAWLSLATAATIGFCIGGLTFSTIAKHQSAIEQASEPSGTISYVYVHPE